MNKSGGEVHSNTICSFKSISKGRNCIEVKSYSAFKNTVESGLSDVIFCGGFNIQKTALVEPAKIDINADVRCIEEC